MNSRQRNLILKRYLTPGDRLAFSGRRNVSNEIGIGQELANNEVLAYNYSYPLHREYKRPKLYNPYFFFSPRDQIQCDLIDISHLKNFNDGVRFLLVCIDIFTKFAWVRPLKSKTASECKTSLAEILDSMDNKPKSIVFDRGTEFLNSQVRRLLTELNIKIINPNSPSKAAFAERFNRSLQSLIYKYLTEKQTNRYIDVLQDLLTSYNTRGHRSIDFLSPIEAEKEENLLKVRQSVMAKRAVVIEKGRKMKAKFRVGDVVRIKKEKRVFDRGFNETFSAEYFKISRILHRLPIPTYEIISLNNGELIEGMFYANELQLIKGDVWKIEKVIRVRKRKGKTEYFVKWLGFDNTHNSWVNEIQR